MNLIEALKKADGRPVCRKVWNVGTCFTFADNGVIIWERNSCPVNLRKEDFFTDDWYVVEPKSKIEEAIEREMVAFYGLPVEKIGGVFPAIINRIVNLTLDEAKKAAWGNGTIESAGRHCGSERIDALKVKL